jgi:hypothetical protein
MDRNRQLEPIRCPLLVFSIVLFGSAALILLKNKSCTRVFKILVQDKPPRPCKSASHPVFRAFDCPKILYLFYQSCMRRVAAGWSRCLWDRSVHRQIMAFIMSCTRISLNLVQDYAQTTAFRPAYPALGKGKPNRWNQSITVVLYQEIAQPGTRLTAFLGGDHA